MTNIDTKRRRRWTAITFIVVVQIFLSYTSNTVVVNAFVTKTISTSTSTLLHPKSSSLSVVGLTIPHSLRQSYTSTTVGTSYTKATTTARQQSKQSMILQHKHHTHRLLHQQRRRLGVGLFSTTAAADAETELPLPAAVAIEAEEEQSHDNNDRKKKKIERMIDKIERKYLSSSRLLRLLFYPLRLLIWKPLRMLMEMFIDRSDKNGNVVVDNTSASTSTSTSTSSVADVEDKIAIVTTSDTDIIDTSSSSSSSSSVADVEDNIPVVTASDTDTIDTTSVPTATATISSDDVVADVGAADVAVTCPIGDRWAISAPDIDLSGKWELIITKEFKKEYDIYLGRLGQPKLVRSVALSAPVIGKTFEELIQTDSGRSLFIHGVNIRGTWDRTLVTSGTSLTDNDFIPLQVPITTVDSEPVEAESWWEDQGRVHMSYLRGVTMYGGGSFVSRRYFEEKNEDEDVVYACESSFVFNDTKKEPNSLTWRFHRQKE